MSRCEAAGIPCKPSPESNASIISKASFSWFTSILWSGYRRSISAEDLFELSQSDTCKQNAEIFVRNLHTNNPNSQRLIRNKSRFSKNYRSGRDEEVLINTDSTSLHFSLLRAIVKSHAPLFCFTSLFKLMLSTLLFINPLILKLLIAFTSNESPAWQGYLIAVGFFVVAIMKSFISGQYFKLCSVVGMRLRSSLMATIYSKSIVLSNSSHKERTVGEIVNLMAVDAHKLSAMIPLLNIVWSGPLLILVSTYFLWWILGLSVLSGLAVMILLIPINAFFSSTAKKLQSKEMKFKDDRIKLLSEVLIGIKAIKMYAWEKLFEEKVGEIRSKELSYLKKSAFLHAIFFFIYLCTPFLVSLAMFGTYVLSNQQHTLDAEKVFISISLLNILKFPLVEMPMAVSTFAQAYVSYLRIKSFINCNEISQTDTNVSDNDDGILVEDATFKWEPNGDDVLQNISMSVKEGSLVAIVGQVGCGKSSLISALLGNMEKTSGRVIIKGSVAYVSQQPWIQNLTIRDNILFGSSLDICKYQDIIEACELKADFDVLPAGDHTEIGEKGVTLSGGQKQRISLARAVYKDCEIYLFDDPLSAVDAHVGKHIFDRVIGSEGCLRNKTRIFVTHNLTFLCQVNVVFAMIDGKIAKVGNYDELLKDDGEVGNFLRSYTLNENSEADPDAFRNRSKVTRKHEHVTSSIYKLITRESPETGNVKMSVLSHYLLSVGITMTTVVVIFFILQNAVLVYSGLWLADWSNDPVNMDGTQNNSNVRVVVYGVVSLFHGLFVLVQVILLHLSALSASQSLHNIMLNRILRCPITFFDQTPTGRIINRFSKDVDTLDRPLINSLTTSLNSVLIMFGSFIIITLATPLFAIAIIPATIVYILIQRFYMRSSRQLKRLQSTTCSPIYSQFSETISGAKLVRAFKMEKNFVEENYRKIDEHHKVHYAVIIATRWLAFRLNMVGSIIVFAAAILAVVARDHINAGMVGLSMTYAIQVTVVLNRVVLRLSQLETDFVAVERIDEYSMLESEAEQVIGDNRPEDAWPHAGSIHFDHYSTRYRKELDLVVKDISIHIKGGEKVSVVGRTGAGKSSLTLALFRIIEPAQGSITIDDVNISCIGLHDLRSRLSIIPQDPVLFSGSLRMNLDPCDRYADDDIWFALEHSHLKNFVQNLSGKLAYEVTEGGDNLSVGQRQLVCLARALLRKSKILVLDEATAAVDLETDELIQETIRAEFKDCTTFTIAHRLNTIMDSTRILVLNQGKVAEFDSPSKLLKAKGIFYCMAKDAGLA